MSETKKQETTETPETPKTNPKTKRLRWSLGCFRTDTGKLSTVYTSVAGEVVPYLRERVGDRPILFHGTYAGMLYSEARKALLKDAAKAGITPEEPSSKAKATSSGSKATPKAQRASKAKSEPAPKKPAAKKAKEA